ncbi:hypothetical protein ACSBR2_013793 [Camellia fascicularis]
MIASPIPQSSPVLLSPSSKTTLKVSEVRRGVAFNGYWSNIRDGSPVSNSISGVKKARMIADEQQPSVRVMYNSLTRGSKRKLEQLLQQRSEWHAQHFSSSHVSNEVLESGEETYFPALHVGLDNPSAVNGSVAPKSCIPQMVAQTLGFGQNLLLLPVMVTAMDSRYKPNVQIEKGVEVQDPPLLTIPKI